MKDIYILATAPSSGQIPQIFVAATTWERCSEEMAVYTAAEQAQMVIQPISLLEDDD